MCRSKWSRSESRFNQHPAWFRLNPLSSAVAWKPKEPDQMALAQNRLEPNRFAPKPPIQSTEIGHLKWGVNSPIPTKMGSKTVLTTTAKSTDNHRLPFDSALMAAWKRRETPLFTAKPFFSIELYCALRSQSTPRRFGRDRLQRKKEHTSRNASCKGDHPFLRRFTKTCMFFVLSGLRAGGACSLRRSRGKAAKTTAVLPGGSPL